MRAQLKLIGITISVKTPEPGRALPAPSESADGHSDIMLSSEDDQAMDWSTAQISPPADFLPPQSQQAPDMFGDINLDDIIVTLKKDDQLSTPVFSVRSSSSESNEAPNPESALTVTPPRSVFNSNLSKDEEQVAINFILA